MKFGAQIPGNQTTWDDMVAANTKLDPKLDLPKDGPGKTD